MAQSGLRSHLSGSLPISIAIHVVALLALFVIPLVANVVIPTVMVTPPDYIRAAPAPPPPAVVTVSQPRASAAPATTESSHVPTVAPDVLMPENTPPTAYTPVPLGTTAGIGADGALTTGLTIVAPQPPEPPRPAGPVKVADLPVAPRKIADARPIYPDLARSAHVEGLVVMEAVLDPSGHVTQLRLVKSVPLLDQAAMDAVRQWRYTPSMYYGKPVSVLMTITIRFTLQ